MDRARTQLGANPPSTIRVFPGSSQQLFAVMGSIVKSTKLLTDPAKLKKWGNSGASGSAMMSPLTSSNGGIFTANGAAA